MRKNQKRFTALCLTLTLLLAVWIIPAGASNSGLPEQSFEERFKNYSGEWAGGGQSPIKLRLQEDTLTLDYSPVFYFDDSFGLTEEEKAVIVDRCVQGFASWAGVYVISGRELSVEVDVHPECSGKKRSANVRVLPRNALFPYGGGIVPGAVVWRPNSPFLTMYLHTDDPQSSWGMQWLAMHEFGHVLGLFDAYGYGASGSSLFGIDVSGLAEWLLPEAPPERASYHSVMHSGWTVSETEIELLLWAWKNKRLQLYTKSALTCLGAQVSPAFGG